MQKEYDEEGRLLLRDKYGQVLKPTSARKTTQAAKKVRNLVARMYLEGQQALAEGKPIAWCKAAGFNDFCRCLDIVPLYPENYAGLCATKRANMPFLEGAEADGFSNVVCAYSRTGLGYARMMAELGVIPPGAPDGGLAQPTVQLDSPWPCDTHLKWFGIHRRYLNVPVFMIDELWVSSADYFREDVKEHYIRYQVDQYRRLVEFLERLVGRKFDWDKFEEMERNSLKATKLYHDACEFRKAIPCPMPTEDMMNVMVPGMMMAGNPGTVDFYQGLYDELKYRAENKVGVIPEEKYRLIWGPGLPPWHSMGIFNWVEEQGAVFVFDLSYKSPDEPPEIPKGITDPLERKVLRQWLGRRVSIERSVVGGYNFIHSENPLEWIEPFHADGVVFHWLRSCRHTTIGNRYYTNLIQEHSGVPTLWLESDICDLRDYSEADWHRKIFAFLETVDAYREQKKRGEVGGG